MEVPVAQTASWQEALTVRRTRIAGAALSMVLVVAAGPVAAERPPSILVITVDALRADRLGAYGYRRDTSPAIDRLLAEGARFTRAWTPEPLTAPAMCAMVTGLEPHQHGASRNGLRMQPGLDSLPKILDRSGWTTAAFVGTWALKHNLTQLGEHFETYGERLDRRRWFGLINSEATGEDLTDDALAWFERHRARAPSRPFLLWVHYIEPHAPYRLHDRDAARLGIAGGQASKSDRYDTEIAAVDRAIARLLDGIRPRLPAGELVVVFTADHGESLGEHDYWGHGRFLYEPELRIPLGVVWPGRIPRAALEPQATLLDLAPTLLELVGLPVPGELAGTSWAQALRGGGPVAERRRCYQAHRGAVHSRRDSDRKRSNGLLAVAIIEGTRKEILHLMRDEHLVFDLGADPEELRSLVGLRSRASSELLGCLAEVSRGLGALDRLAADTLDGETVEQLRALGYLE
jgi:arylsulfatase A-like enzyme